MQPTPNNIVLLHPYSTFFIAKTTEIIFNLEFPKEMNKNIKMKLMKVEASNMLHFEAKVNKI